LDLWVWYTYNGGLLYAFSFVVLEVEGRKEGRKEDPGSRI